MKNETGDIFNELNDIAAHARTGNYSDAASGINTAFAKIQSLLNSGNIPEENLKKLSFSLETMFLMQEQGDWVAVADVLEFEFTPILKNALSVEDA